MKIEVGDYVRTKKHGIFKILSKRETPYGYYCGATDSDKQPTFTIGKGGNVEIKNDIIKHSKNIIDLIEVGDILKLKDGEKWEVQEHQGAGNWIQTEWEVIENEEDFKNKVDSIVTHEQFSSLEYKI